MALKYLNIKGGSYENVEKVDFAITRMAGRRLALNPHTHSNFPQNPQFLSLGN